MWWRDSPERRRVLVETAPAVLLAVLWLKLVLLAGPLEARYVQYPVERRAGTATLALLMLACAPFALLPRTWRAAGVLVLSALASGVALADLLHMDFFGDVVSAADLSRAGQLHGVIPSVLELLRPAHLLLFTDLALGAALLPAYLRLCRSTPALPLWIRQRAAGALAAAAIIVGIPAAILVTRDEEDVFQFGYTHRQIALAVGLLPYHVYDAAVYAAYPLRGRLGITTSDRDAVRRFVARRGREAAEPSPLFGAARNANVVLVMAESLHDFPIGMRVGGRSVTPHLDEFAHESLRFVNFFDQTHLGSTSDGHFTSLQSLHPLEAGAVATRFGANEYHGLPAIVAERGYATVSIAGQPAEYWNMRSLNERLGFHRSEFADAGFPADRRTMAKALAILEDLPQPFLAFVVSFTNHHPFTLVPEEEDLLPVGEIESTLTGRYLQSVHYFDRAFGDLLEGLRRTGLLDTSLIVLYGDHRARLPETPELIRLLEPDRNHEIGRWLESRRLPLIIRLPHGARAGVQTAAGGHLDVSPTILALLGMRDTAAVMLGRDLTRGGRSLVVFRDGSFTDGERHFLRRFGPVGASLAWDDRTGRLDPAALTEQSRRANEELRISDLILHGNLLPWLRRTLRGETPEARVAGGRGR